MHDARRPRPPHLVHRLSSRPSSLLLEAQVRAPLKASPLPSVETRHSGRTPMNAHNGRCSTGHHLLSRHVRRHYLAGDRSASMLMTSTNALDRVCGVNLEAPSSPGVGCAASKSSCSGRVFRFGLMWLRVRVRVGAAGRGIGIRLASSECGRSTSGSAPDARGDVAAHP